MDISSIVIAFIVGFFSAAVLAFTLWRQQSPNKQPPEPLAPPPSRPDPVFTLMGEETGIDLLTEMVRLQSHYEQTQIVPEKTIVLVRDFLNVLGQKLDVEPIEIFGTQVAFDPDKHKAHEYHDKGAPVWVVQPGWRQGNDILKWPIVQTQPITPPPFPINPLTILLGDGTDLDLLTFISRLLYYYELEEQLDTDVAIALKECLTTIIEQTGLTPLEKIGEHTRFNPKLHYDASPCSAGTLVIIKQPGWKLKDEILKQAVVQTPNAEAHHG